MDEIKQYKIILLGDSSVGKTSIINRYCKQLFSDNLDSTVGVNYQQKIIKVNNREIRLSIWDTAGQEKFRTITRQFYRKVDGVILVYDISNKESLENLEKVWLPELTESVEKGYELMIVGNKKDLAEHPDYKNSIIPMGEGEALARKYGTLFVEASAKSNENVESAFQELIFRLVEKQPMADQGNELKLNENNNEDGCFC